MTATLGRPGWMADPATVAVMDALEAAGGGDCARFVGGCVRNTLLGRPVDDIDIATRLTPPQVTTALKAAGLRAVPTGIDHGTVTAISGRRPFEITTLRRDVATDGRRAVVSFTEDWAEDAQRRDFTLNALYANRGGTVFDPVGNGVADAHARKIVFVGDAATRIAEDHLRILRFFRFHAWYGREPADAAGLTACTFQRESLRKLAAERVSKELLKLLAADDPRPAVRLMVQTDVLGVILPAPADLPRFEALVPICPDPVLRLAALLPDDASVARDTAGRLRLSNSDRDRICLALDQPLVRPDTTAELHRALYALGLGVFLDRAHLAWARDGATPWETVIAQAGDWTRPAFPVTGNDLIGAGIGRGPQLGQTLRELESWWVDQDFIPDREVLLARLTS